MKTSLSFLAAALLSVAIMAGQTDTTESMSKLHQKPRYLRAKSTQTFEVNYLIFLPQGYDRKAEKRWPLILFLHGAGERGTNLTLVARHGPPKIVKDKPNFPFVVVSPQCASGQHWSNDALLALLGKIVKKEAIDPDRVYLTGLSMGGYGTWSLGLQEPQMFAAIAPICGGGDTISILLPDPAKQKALRTLPVWAFHGGKDPAVNISESRRMIDALHQIKNQAELTVYPEAGHDSWTETYNNPKFYDWLLSHTLKDRP